MLVQIWKEENTVTLLVGMQIGAATVENNMVVSQKTKNRTTIGPRNSTPGYIFKNKNTNLKRALTPMFTEALFIVPKT